MGRHKRKESSWVVRHVNLKVTINLPVVIVPVLNFKALKVVQLSMLDLAN